MELGSGKTATLMELFLEVESYIQNEKYTDTSEYVPFWDVETRTVVLIRPYQLYMFLKKETSVWQVMDSSCTSSIPCIFITPLETLDPKHVRVLQLQIIVEVFQDRELNHQTFVRYVVLQDFDMVKHFPSRWSNSSPRPRSSLCLSQGLQSPGVESVAKPSPTRNCVQNHWKSCFLCLREQFPIGPHFEDKPDGTVINMLHAVDSDITTHIHYVKIVSKSIAHVCENVCKCLVVATLLKCHMHSESLIDFVMVLQNDLFPTSALLNLGEIYRVHVPLDAEIVDMRRQSAPFELQTLPWTVLPNKIVFLHHICPLSSPENLLLPSVKGLTHVTGCIFSRKLLNQKFGSEICNTVDIPGFGVPGEKTIMLELHCEATDSKCLYLNNWGNKLYPLGLVPGTQVLITNVFRRTSSKGTSYFQVNDLTGITIKSIPEVQVNYWLPPADITFAPNFRAGAPISCQVDSWKLLRVDINHICACGALRKKLLCVEVNCLHPTNAMKVEARGRLITYGPRGSIIIHFRDDNLRRILGMSEDHWDALKQLSLKSELKYNNQLKYRPEKHNFIENIFHAFCKQPRQNTTLFLQCRNFSKNKNKPEMARTHSTRSTPKEFAEIPQVFAFHIQLFPPKEQVLHV